MNAPAPRRGAFLTLADLAPLMGLSTTTLAERLPQWERQGFPAPLPWTQRPRLWRREAVERWMATQERRAGAGGSDAA